MLEHVYCKASCKHGISRVCANGASRGGMDLCWMWNELLSRSGCCIKFQPSQFGGTGGSRFRFTFVSRINIACGERLHSSGDFALGSDIGGDSRGADAGKELQYPHHRDHLCGKPAAGSVVQPNVKAL